MVGICPGGIWHGGYCPAGICPGGICPGGICPGVFVLEPTGVHVMHPVFNKTVSNMLI